MILKTSQADNERQHHEKKNEDFTGLLTSLMTSVFTISLLSAAMIFTILFIYSYLDCWDCFNHWCNTFLLNTLISPRCSYHWNSRYFTNLLQFISPDWLSINKTWSAPVGRPYTNSKYFGENVQTWCFHWKKLEKEQIYSNSLKRQ